MKRLILILAPAALFLASCKSENIKEPNIGKFRMYALRMLACYKQLQVLDLVYYNPNDFGVTLSQARGDVYIDNMYFGRLSISDKVAVRKHQEFIIPAELKMDNISAVKNHREIFKKKQAVIRIEGFATLKKAGFNKEVPIKYEGIQDIERLRAIVSN
jgi:Conserved secreted protein